jgi:hypothetical protein
MCALAGHDARHNSARFAAVAAAVFISQGVHVHLFSTHVPTPYVAAAVTELGAACGVMVTGERTAHLLLDAGCCSTVLHLTQHCLPVCC